MTRERRHQSPARFQPAVLREARTPEASTEHGDPRRVSPWMNSAEVAEYLRKPSRAAVRMWARRQSPPVVPVRSGGQLLYARRDVEAALRPAVDRHVRKTA